MKHITRLALLLLLAPAILPLGAQTSTNWTHIEDVVYGHKIGVALTMDVLRPDKPNGAGIIYVISGGWFSNHSGIRPARFKTYLDRGYTVFAVVHGSQPKFIIPEIFEDMHRAVRFIRHNAAKYGVDPNKLGITGASAGGHLSLCMGTMGRPGPAKAPDPVDRESSGVQAVACFFPPTDFLNYGAAGEDAVGVGTLEKFKPAFGPRSDTAEERQKYGREISPIYFVSSGMPPTLIVHGDADKLVPIQQAESFAQRAREAGTTVKVITKPGVAHGWPKIEEDLPSLADWFDEHLLGIRK